MRNRRRRRRRRAKEEAEEVPDARIISLPELTELSIKGEEGKPRSRIRDAGALRRSLRGQIRLYFLDAISHLPTADLNTTLARGLLIAGHCYGALHPVDNILLNSIWYSAAFPLRPDDRIDVNVINDTAISRIVQRSLDGSVAFLRHHCPGLSHEDALWHLSLSGADLRAAVASARGAAPSLLPPTEPEAFEAAAKAARHPKPAALALFASSVMPYVKRDAVSLLNNKRRLSSADILRLSTMLLPSPLPDELPHPPLQARCTEAFQIIARRRNNLIRWYRRWVEMAYAALSKYAHQTAAHYQLHIIYGLGTLKDDEFSPHQSYHINFMAWPKDPSSARDAPLFFFAEAHGPSGSVFCEEDITLCCTVQPSPSEVATLDVDYRCFDPDKDVDFVEYLDQDYTRYISSSPWHCHHKNEGDVLDCCHTCLTKHYIIDHPGNSENFGGGQYFKMDGISKDWDCPVALDVDYRCFDPDRDVDLVEYLDQDYADYISSSAWHSPHKNEGSVLGYCSGIM